MRSIERASRTASFSASARTASRITALASFAVIPLTRSSAAICSARDDASSSRSRSRSRSFSKSFRSRCSIMSVRWSSCSSRVRRRRSSALSSARLPRASSSASRCRRSFSSLASRIRSFCWVRASATMRPAFSWAPRTDWAARMPRATNPATRPQAMATTRATAARTGFSMMLASRPAG